MSLEDIIGYSFPEQTFESWRQKAEESLKGKSLESLSRKTYENIQLKPLYTKEDRAGCVVPQFPGQGDYRRGSKALGYIEENWKIAQKINAPDLGQLQERLTSSMNKGQNTVSFVPTEEIVKELSTLLQNLDQNIPFAVNAGDYLEEILAAVEAVADQNSGYIAKDPVSLRAQNGRSFAGDEVEYAQFAQTIQKGMAANPNLKTILTDTTVYHNGGASAVQELAIALATAVYHIEQLKSHGLSVDDIVPKMVFHFSIGSHFFTETAKLRAARVLWSKMTEAYQVAEELQGQMEISADTSWFTKTAYDPYVNLLRAGNEAFAAVLGGVQYLHVSPFDEPEGKSSEFSERIARNTQLLLRNEARLGSIIDPAGGSWYIESLTDELAEKAWALFLEIDEKGGIAAVLESGWLQAQIEEVKAKRMYDTATRKQTIVGTNQYANLKDKPLTAQVEETGLVTDFAPVKQERLAEPYEKLRQRAEKLAQMNQEPISGLICLGYLKNHKARADFIDGFLAPGGIAAERSGELQSSEDVSSFINEKKCDFYVLCGSDAQYAESGLSVIKTIRESFPELQLYVAGLAPEGETEAWKQAGVIDFITMKSNCYETLRSFLNEIEVKKVHE
ncbi:methylmalonyl-CoA mutase family protein [Bacillus benzoevorans]|uniref:Methylmalonyl-CoA mutase n=1 Tax=Bacillus benzoevorans TaxID=1456 RepID=A0A7X0LUS5_9BACI|nr:methylmalonyl-CoA mutase family protein [Bacillus benzoevorans]MBB6444853.1 methylmalonyl-CoA mutase [Bacillus benzoevorans]